jgi:hypothetical protein
MCYFDCFQDDLNMTLQVALVGRDGFVIASDTQGVRGVDGIDSKRYAASGVRKILHSVSHRVVCAFSGDQIISNCAQRLLKLDLASATEETLRELLQNEIERIFKDCTLDLPPQAPARICGQLILAISGRSKLWEISFAYGQRFVTSVSNHLIGGDLRNSAVFLVDRLHRDGVERSVDELKVLAAHTVLQGHFVNPTSVGGLDVFVSKNGETPDFLGNDELEVLRARSESLHNMLVSEIFG